MKTDFQPLSRDEVRRLREALAGNGNNDGAATSGLLMGSDTGFVGVCTADEARLPGATITALASIPSHY